MSNELQPIAAGGAPPAVRKASFNRIAAQWKQQFSEYLAEHPNENLLFVLKDVALNEKNSPLTRVKAASEALKFMMPQLMQIEVDPPDVAVLEEITTLQKTIRQLVTKKE